MLESEKGRVEKLLPLRHGRMAVSPFTFYRGSALTMAYDLSTTPASGLNLQICGDAHLSNFGGFATPERNVIFSINDLDETHKGPWEWDVKRLAASFLIASRNNNLSDKDGWDTARACVKAYRTYMAEYSDLNPMALWHYALDADMLIGKMKDPELRQRASKRLETERAHSISEDIFPKVAVKPDLSMFIEDKLPALFHWEDHTPGEIMDVIQEAFDKYRESLQPAYRLLLDRYELVDAAIKVVGVGSVGTMCWVFLLVTGDGDRFFLQAKEARRSVLENFAGDSPFPNHGQRIINGYRLMQPFSDPFLGWTEGRLGRHYFFRQLRDTKISIKVETFGKKEMLQYADWCGQALALAHARSGDAAMLSGYMGKSDTFETAVADFSLVYADQNEKDHAALRKAIRQGKIKAEKED
jgi:uncharacterized protein (DUF2252 family)